MKVIEIKNDEDRLKVGRAIKKELGVCSKKEHNFFDWQWLDSTDEYTVFEFYWNFISPDIIYHIMSFMKENSSFNPRIEGGRHDNQKATIWQAMLRLEVPNEIKVEEKGEEVFLWTWF